MWGRGTQSLLEESLEEDPDFLLKELVTFRLILADPDHC